MQLANILTNTLTKDQVLKKAIRECKKNIQHNKEKDTVHIVSKFKIRDLKVYASLVALPYNGTTECMIFPCGQDDEPLFGEELWFHRDIRVSDEQLLTEVRECFWHNFDNNELYDKFFKFEQDYKQRTT